MEVFDWNIDKNDEAQFGKKLFEQLFSSINQVVDILLKVKNACATKKEIEIANDEFDKLVNTYSRLDDKSDESFVDCLNEYARVTRNCLRMNNAEAYKFFPKGSELREKTDRKIAVFQDIRMISVLSACANKDEAKEFQAYQRNYCDYAKNEGSFWGRIDNKYSERPLQ